MHRYLLLFVLGLSFCGIAIGALVLWHRVSASSSPQDQIRAVFQVAIDRDDPDNVQLGQTVIDGDYALQLWQGNTTGGEGLLRFDSGSGQWMVLTENGGVWSTDGLVSWGVPLDIAQTLLSGISP